MDISNQRNRIMSMASEGLPAGLPLATNKSSLFLRNQAAPGGDGGFDIEIAGDQKQFVTIISAILNSRNQTQIFHWQTAGAGSYAAHMALGAFYDALPALADVLVESYQGKYGILTGYKSQTYIDFTDVEQLVQYFTELDQVIEENRGAIKESYIQNQIDTVSETINSTLYKLKFLQ